MQRFLSGCLVEVMKTLVALITAAVVALGVNACTNTTSNPAPSATVPSPIASFAVTQATAEIVKADPKVAAYIPTITNVFTQLPTGTPPTPAQVQTKIDTYVNALFTAVPSLKSELAAPLAKVEKAVVKDYTNVQPTLSTAISAADVAKSYSTAISAGATATPVL